ncbi:M48 family metallopeptidase [Sphingomonas sp. ACRSK]|uniref:M48 family metallopeptidase n=1 Tax=Sphingomonas sp. ACRSK TaxID=2918213 RepID=UPI001EF44F4D|nr:M48 family metallopeptidase [Sphingomonas sp. ACRSK]MCG7349811.1 M48 family metallopeptidase [Sphingomonas sp. ACRSK]
MNVTNGIELSAFRHPGCGDGGPLSSKEEFREHRDCTTHFAMNRECRQMVRRGRRASLGQWIGAALAAWLVALPAPAADPVFPTIRAADTKLARIGYRLATANASLCDRQEPGLGLILHTPEQYSRDLRTAAIRYFKLDGPVGVEGVIDGSPAENAGIRIDDTLLAIGSAQFASANLEGEATTTAAIRAAAQLAALSSAKSLVVRGMRNGTPYTQALRPVPACRSRFEVEIGTEWTAKADGEMVQIGSPFLETYPEDQVAAVVAHELAHNILRHRERLEARGVDYGMLSGFGRNVRYFRQTELEADVLSVSLLANAGYDPEVAVRFWQDFGPKRAGGILRSRSHPAWQDRVSTIRYAIAQLGPERPRRPALLATRDRPLDGNWQALLVKAR